MRGAYKRKLPKERPTVLTKRQLEVIRLIRDGYTFIELGKKLGISAATVKVHVYNAGEITGMRGGMELVMYCLRKGLISLGPEYNRG